MSPDPAIPTSILAGLIVEQAAQIQAHRAVLTYLAKESGIDIAKFNAMLDDEVAQSVERILIGIGDKYPELAELLDTSERLKQRRQSEEE